ncbi:RES family NAD+ phosphorylase [Enteractinococcus coprophilus]|uniref:RES domain-containing protein n=1 Tax=Enteractinococcus coprophilus TaxID=1027633 RepID=A0A543AN32_9MICC|nr:RES family NAD+ phosphorylase [Enteractinococcus coprophilus]TQL73969.1 RES domain-containing protein [Enteractinococcus coprophilus]
MVETQWPTGLRVAETFTVQTQQLLYRVLNNDGGRRVTDFNPGYGAPTRFAFFTDDAGDIVPVLYAAYSAEAAISETLLRDIPAAGGALIPADYMRTVMAAFRTRRTLKLAKFMGTGLRALGTTHQALTSSDMHTYPKTVRWAQAAHRAGYEGVAWMSNRCNDTVAVVLFGDRVESDALVADPSVARIFSRMPDRNWLADICFPLGIRVRW